MNRRCASIIAMTIGVLIAATLPMSCGSPDPTTLDFDDDGTPDYLDAFPVDPAEQADTDGDGVGDHADALPEDPDETLDTDGDGVGNNSDSDDDNDGVLDANERPDPLDPDV